MTATIDPTIEQELERVPTDDGPRRRRALQTPYISLFILGVFFIAGLIGPIVAPHDPNLVDLSRATQPPAWLDGGSWSYVFGTDQLGRDILSRLLVGARVSLLVSLTVVLISGTVGVTLALVAGYRGGRLDSAITRTTDAAMAFPLLVLAIVVVATFGASTFLVVLILALAGWPQYARVVRSEVLSLKTLDFVTMSRVSGGQTQWIMRRHLLPNIVSTILVLATLQMGLAIIAEGSLSFLGIGVPPPAASWGGMLADGRQQLTSAWWLALIPGIALSLTVLAANVVGDWLRVKNDPTARK